MFYTGKSALYACEAGCQSQVISLKRHPQIIPVFITDPETPILYISDNK